MLNASVTKLKGSVTTNVFTEKSIRVSGCYFISRLLHNSFAMALFQYTKSTDIIFPYRESVVNTFPSNESMRDISLEYHYRYFL